ncbi:MAG: tRNA(His) guanylyltransferase Thg1 family protein [Candidatus Aenigmatarchaeota archaeon]
MPRKPWQHYGMPPPKSEASGGRLSLKDYEIYSGIEVPAGPFFVRLDGWGFHALANRLKLKRPFDKRLAAALAKSAAAFFVPFNPALCYIFSDEANFLFLKRTSFRRIEKIDSVFAGLFSALFSKLMRMPAAFDCRVIPLERFANIRRYLAWRQAECFRNHNNAWAQWVAIRKDRLSPCAANARLEGMDVRALTRYCRTRGIDLQKTPAWQRRGVLLRQETYRKRGYDPIRKVRVVVTRRRISTDWAPPLFASREGKSLLDALKAEQ